MTVRSAGGGQSTAALAPFGDSYAGVLPNLGPGQALVIRTRLADRNIDNVFSGFDPIFDLRRQEADAFYETVHRPGLSADERSVQRQALAGLIWSKQFYHYSVELWREGDPAGPPPVRT